MEKILGIIIIIYVILFLGINLDLGKNKKIEKIIETIEKRSQINSLLMTVFWGCLITTIMTNQTNQIAEKQVNITERETAPAFRITAYEEGEKEEYKLINGKGMASYVTLDVYERYSFNYSGEQYEVNLAFFNQELDERFNMDDECKELIFVLENSGFNRGDSLQVLKDCLYMKVGEVVPVSDSRELKLNFFDYKNDRYTFRFSEYDDKIRLVDTSSKSYFPTRNITVFFRENEDLENQIRQALDFVFDNYDAD